MANDVSHINDYYFQLNLDTTAPSVTIDVGDASHRVKEHQVDLTINCSATDKFQYKIYGQVLGIKKFETVGDGVKTEFTLTDSNLPTSIASVALNGVTQNASEYTYDSTTGKLTFVNSAPGDGVSIEVRYTGLLDIEGAADWQNWGASGNTKVVSIKLDDTFAADTNNGNRVIKVKVRDDVYNESAEATVTAVLDTTKPVVSIVLEDDHNDRTPNPKVSREDGKRTYGFSWQCNEDFAEYKICVVANSTEAVTTAAPIAQTYSSNMSGTGTFPKETPLRSVIDGRDLYNNSVVSGTDGHYVIKIFVKDISGNWSA